MGEKILLIGGNYFPEPTGIGKYNGEMMDWFSNQGYSCTVITTYPYYPYWQVQDPYKKQCFWYKKEIRSSSKNSSPITIIRAPHYVPKNPSGIKRIISDFSFFFTSYLIILTFLFRKKYDYVLTVAPPFQLGLLAVMYKKIKGAKFLYHIQDLQIDAARDLGMIKSAFILKVLFVIEKLILKNADVVSSISQGMIRKIISKCEKNIIYFPNWVDSRKFFPIVDKAKLKENFGYHPSDFIILYSGAIGEKQGLEAILFSAKKLQDYKNIKFLICGSGPYKERLKQLKEELEVTNVYFSPLQPSAKFNEFLNMADVHLVLQKVNASDLVMPSKLTTILSVGGIAIVTASAGTSLHDLISEASIGVLIEPENQDALNNAVISTVTSNLSDISNKARLYAERNLSIDRILQDYLKHVVKDPKLEQNTLKDKKFEAIVYPRNNVI